MKIGNIFLTLIFLPAFCNAEIKWARGPFWQTAYETELTLKTSGETKELKAECTSFESSALTDVHPYFDLETFDLLDKMPLGSDMMNETFVFDLKIEVEPNLLVVKNVSERPEITSLVDMTKKLDVLPDYTQSPTEMRLRQFSFKGKLSHFEKQANLVQSGKKVGAVIEAPEIRFNGQNYLIRFKNKSLACDFISSRINLGSSFQAEIKTTLENQLKIQKHYDTVADIANSAISDSNKSQIRAALFGFRMAKKLFSETADSLDEARLLETMNLIFKTDSMERSGVWSPSFQDSILSVSGTTDPVDVIVRFNHELKGKL